MFKIRMLIVKDSLLIHWPCMNLSVELYSLPVKLLIALKLKLNINN